MPQKTCINQLLNHQIDEKVFYKKKGFNFLRLEKQNTVKLKRAGCIWGYKLIKGDQWQKTWLSAETV